MKLVSVVVPVYNVEAYLEKCIDSLIHQDYENVEIILVDDGSTDNSGEICDKYSEQYSNVITIHQKNMGLSGARNTGTANANGEYIAYIDSDDWVSDDYVSYQIALSEKYNADIVVISDISVWSDGDACVPQTINEKIECFDAEKALEQMCYGHRFGPSACKMFRAELVKRNLFPLGVLYEDLAVMFKIIGECTNLVYSNLPKYFYRRRASSIINQDFNDRHLIILEHTKKLRNYINEHFPSVLDAAMFESAYVITQLMPLVINSNSADIYKKLRTEMKSYYKSVIKNMNVSNKYKIRCFSIVHGWWLTKIEYKFESLLKKKTGKTMAD